MKYRLAIRSLLAALGIWLSIGSSFVFAETALADGKYTADYLVLKAEDDSVSMANDYWEKPATVVVSGGTAKVQLKINHSKWVTEFKVPGNGGYVDTKVVVVNKREDKRVVEFSANVTEPIVSKIHVTVPDIDYDHDYTIRLVFNLSSFKLVSSAGKDNGSVPAKEPTSTPAATGKTEPGNAKAEPTGSEAPKPASEPSGTASSTQKPETATKSSATAKADAVSASEKSPEGAANADEASSESSLASERPTDEAPSTEELNENNREAASPSASPSGEALVSDKDDRQTAASSDGEANQAAVLTGTDAPTEASNSGIQWWIAGAVVLFLAGAAFYIRRSKNRQPQA